MSFSLKKHWFVINELFVTFTPLDAYTPRKTTRKMKKNVHIAFYMFAWGIEKRMPRLRLKLKGRCL